MSKNNDHQLDEGTVRRIISPITKLLDAPDDLCEFLQAIEGFQPILELYKTLSDNSEINVIAKIPTASSFHGLSQGPRPPP